MKKNQKLLLVGGGVIAAYLIYKAYKNSQTVGFANAIGTTTTSPRGSSDPNPMQIACQTKLQVQLNCINSSNAAWYYGIRTSADIERFKADYMRNCMLNTISTMFPSNMCSLGLRGKK